MKAYQAALYIHIPFCKRKCDYCDFYSVCDLSLQKDLLEQIGYQIHNLKKQYNISTFKTVYFGGGTPGLVSSELLSKLLSNIKNMNRGKLPEEITLECNPSNVSIQSLQFWKDMGISRLSLGVQSFQDDFLKRAGRQSSRKRILNALTLIGEASSFDVNIDLIQGLPGMKMADQMKDLEEAVNWNPDHISWYSLILEKGTVLENKWEERNLFLNEENDLVWETGCQYLKKAGYERYEISNFCHKGKKSIHNSAYWKLEPFLGCGPSAVSMLKNSGGSIFRFKTGADAADFARGVIKYEDREIMESTDFLKDFLLMGLRQSEGIPITSFESIFGKTVEELFPVSLERWLDTGCLMRENGRLFPSERGMNLLNSVLISLFEEIDSKRVTFCPNWPLE